MYKHKDVVWVSFPFSDGSDIKARPALVLSNSAINKTGDYLLVQITTKVKNDGLSIEIDESDFISGTLEVKSYLRIHKIFILNESLILKKQGAIRSAFLKKSLDKLLSVISE